MNLLDDLVCCDFETEAINGSLPPLPVGASIKMPGKPSYYLAWGHPSGNNCSHTRAVEELNALFKYRPILCHNATFDISVAKYHMGIDFPTKLHDTLILLFLNNPHALTLSLKPSAEKILGRPALEQTELYDWIKTNVPGAKSNFGAYISKAPGDMVAPYACADTDMTHALFCEMYKEHKGKAYDREMQLMPILCQSTLDGIRLDEALLYQDFIKYSKIKVDIENRIYKKLGTSFNLDSGPELAKAVENNYEDISWLKTKTGKNATNKASLAQAINDPELLALLNYRATVTTFVGTFLTSWVEKNVNGRLHFTWNQVRNNEQNGGFAGTRTGRLSSNPSMLNVPSRKVIVPEGFGLPPLPIMKKYFLPEEGHGWCENDYASQEIRLLAHYDDDALMRAFQAEPRLDMHAMMSSILTDATGKELTRLSAKTTAFSILYGSGIPKLAEGLGLSEYEARQIKSAYLRHLPGIKNIQDSIKATWDSGEPIQTWGGRKYFKEPSKTIEDKVSGLPRTWDFTYKGLNYLIQGSSADVTKQAIINYHEAKSQDARFLLSVHDSINISAPDKFEVKVLTDAMMDIAVDVPMICDSKYGPNYGMLVEFEGE
jgi:DNA polymerase I-like protein with 3'-5' exonuclease and polymerase domains